MYNIKTELISNIIEEHLVFCKMIDKVCSKDNFYSYAIINERMCELISTEYCGSKALLYRFSVQELNKDIIVAFTDERVKSFISFTKSVKNMFSVLNSNIADELVFILIDNYSNILCAQVSTYTVVNDEQREIHCCRLHNLEYLNRILDGLGDFVVDITYTLLENIISDIYSDYICDSCILDVKSFNTQTDFFMFCKIETGIPIIEDMENIDINNNINCSIIDDDWKEALVSLQIVMSKIDKRKFYKIFGLDLSNLLNKINIEISSMVDNNNKTKKGRFK